MGWLVTTGASSKTKWLLLGEQLTLRHIEDLRSKGSAIIRAEFFSANLTVTVDFGGNQHGDFFQTSQAFRSHVFPSQAGSRPRPAGAGFVICKLLQGHSKLGAQCFVVHFAAVDQLEAKKTWQSVTKQANQWRNIQTTSIRNSQTKPAKLGGEFQPKPVSAKFSGGELPGESVSQGFLQVSEKQPINQMVPFLIACGRYFDRYILNYLLILFMRMKYPVSF